MQSKNGLKLFLIPMVDAVIYNPHYSRARIRPDATMKARHDDTDHSLLER
ncbi:hypothetical protein CUJ84_pRLN2000546 (plasmid) [Rhizobium leguminosarum]|uniref:Uncharacterized protein n=1 Tax=Rhizobium leguminosarum TaxID=384 RepID=A0A2K9ZFT0_RHILE|nr:hypothetical protein CUJ84_pRLN2000546 [Rhizobium leguminosarum]